MAKEEKLKIPGKIIGQERGIFIVESDLGSVSCTIGGKLRTRKIRLTVGDKVNIEVSAYDTTRGRIVDRRKDTI